MKKIVMTCLLLAVGIPVGSGPAYTAVQENKTLDTAANGTAEVLKALDGMSRYLRSLDKFTIEADATYDEVLENGQKIQLSRSVHIKADMPSALWAKASSRYSNQEFFYNGKTFTISTPELGYYASFATSETVGKVIVAARDKYDIEMPLSDLFLWGSQHDTDRDVNEAFIVGVDTIQGTDCIQYAISGAEIDWQIWIPTGKTPLPLKMVITSREQTSQPQYSVVMHWNTAPTLQEDIFTFTPAEGAQKINFQTAMAAKQEKKQ